MKRVIRFFALLSLMGLLLLPPMGLLADENKGQGAISGSLTNGTTGERVPGVEVVLKRYEGDQEIEDQKTLSDPEGKFYFSGLDQGEGHNYILNTLYKGVEYDSPPVVFKDQQREIPLDITVYDTTDSDKKILVVMHHVLMEPREGALWVRELMIVENHDNRVYVGSHEIEPDKKETVRISVPPQAREIEPLRGLMSGYIVQLPDGFADTMGIKPGRKEIQFRYKVDYGTSNLTLPKRINLMTSSLDFFIPDGIKAVGENVQYAGLVGEPGKQFLHFSGKNLPKDSQAALTLEGLLTKKKSFKGIAPILAIALVGIGLIYPLLRRRKKPGETKKEIEADSEEELTLQEERQNILRAIAELDDLMDSGQISPEEHHKKRRLLKERIVALTQTMKEKGE